MARIVETDNYGGDYPHEKFLNIPVVTEEEAWQIAQLIQRCVGTAYHRYWKAVPNDYKLNVDTPNDC